MGVDNVDDYAVEVACEGVLAFEDEDRPSAA